MKIMKTIATYAGAGLIAFSPMGCYDSQIKQLEQQKAQLKRERDSLQIVKKILTEKMEIKKQKIQVLEEIYKESKRYADSIANLNFKNAKKIAVDTAKRSMHY